MGTATAGKERLAILGADGRVEAGWPVLGPFRYQAVAFDQHGAPFFVNRPSGLDTLETIDRP